MSNGMTIDALYEAFMDIDEEGDPLDVKTPFAEDVFTFFGKGELGGYKQEEWAKQYGTYLPTWDPSQVNLAARERSLDYRDALDTLFNVPFGSVSQAILCDLANAPKKFLHLSFFIPPILDINLMFGSANASVKY